MRDNARVLSVKEITGRVAGIVNGNMSLKNVCVRGEISTYSEKPSRFDPDTTFLYFSLIEGKVPLPCVMFEGVDAILDELRGRGVTLRPGVSVVCEGNIEVYEPFGKYQLKCYDISLDGAGANAAALEELTKRLRGEGLFEQNRPIPKFPKKIAVVTSPTGAVLQDIKTTVSRRYPITELVVIPATVQGENAVPSLIEGLQRAQTVGADVIIFGRGGGSNEDLSCFNSEALARAIFASKIPTISAVGHETDTTIADLAADLRAPTPTAAAELAVPNIAELSESVAACENRAARAMARKLSQCEERLSSLSKDVLLNSPRGRIAAWSSRLESVEARLKNRIRQRLDRSEQALNLAVNTINGVNPLAVLSRGYSVATKGGKAIKSAEELSVGDVIEVKLNKGEVSAQVTKITN